MKPWSNTEDDGVCALVPLFCVKSLYKRFFDWKEIKFGLYTMLLNSGSIKNSERKRQEY